MTERIYLDEFIPVSELAVDTNPVQRAKFPAIDAHLHISSPKRGPEEIAGIVEDLDSCGVKAVTDLNGGSRRPLAGELQVPGSWRTFTAGILSFG